MIRLQSNSRAANCRKKSMHIDKRYQASLWPKEGNYRKHKQILRRTARRKRFGFSFTFRVEGRRSRWQS